MGPRRAPSCLGRIAKDRSSFCQAIAGLGRVAGKEGAQQGIAGEEEQGFRVRLVRGAGVSQGTWQEVQEVVTATPDGLPVLVLRLRGGRTTTIPVTILATDRETFVRDLVSRAQGGQGLRPLS